MSEFYNQNYSKEQIAAVLTKIQDCIREGRFIISKNESRRENIDFINNYNLNSKRQKEILLRIEPEDFCHSLQNMNIGFEYEVLLYFAHRLSYLILMVLRSGWIFTRNSTLLKCVMEIV